MGIIRIQVLFGRKGRRDALEDGFFEGHFFDVFSFFEIEGGILIDISFAILDIGSSKLELRYFWILDDTYFVI